MRVVELYFPGKKLEFEGKDKIEVKRLLDHLEFVIADAAISLSLYEESVKDKGRKPGEMHEKMMELRGCAFEEVSMELGLSKIPDDHQHELDRRFKIKQAESGFIPLTYERRLPFIHAHSFLYAVDSIGKLIGEVANLEGVPEEVKRSVKQFSETFPSVRFIRNSALHIEDRLQGYGPPWEKKKMEVGLSLGNLFGNKLCYTIEDGSQQGFEVCPGTLYQVVEIANQLLASFEWSGPSSLKPNY